MEFFTKNRASKHSDVKKILFCKKVVKRGDFSIITENFSCILFCMSSFKTKKLPKTHTQHIPPKVQKHIQASED